MTSRALQQACGGVQASPPHTAPELGLAGQVSRFSRYCIMYKRAGIRYPVLHEHAGAIQ